MKFHFIIVSKDHNFMLEKPNIDVFSSDDSVIWSEIPNNEDPITSVYNECIKYDVEDNGSDFVIFMHADVKLDIVHLINHIKECSEKYDVMGLCGCEKFVSSKSPLNWFCGSHDYPGFRWGCVTHGELYNQRSFFSGDRESITDHRVACIDGLCIIMSKKSIEAGLRFDEQFMFDQYDTDISLQTVLKYRFRLGVIVETSLCHYSVGRSILTDDFLRHEIDLRKKWNFDIPKGSKIEKIYNYINNPVPVLTCSV